MPTEKGMYVFDTDASVVAISGILHQEQKWNGRRVLHPIEYGSKVLSDTETKYMVHKRQKCLQWSHSFRGEVPRILRERSF